MKQVHSSLPILLIAALLHKFTAATTTPAFVADIVPIAEDGTVTGTVVVFGEGSTVAFAGHVQNAPPELEASECTGTYLFIRQANY